MANMSASAERRRNPYLKVKAFIVEKGLSQRDIAQFLGKSPSALNQNLNGTGGDFSLSEARLLIKEYNIPPDYFFDI